MRTSWSQFEQAWRDTLVHKAEGAAFRKLCSLYGLPLPARELEESSWDKVLYLNAYGTRGNFRTVYASTENIFSEWNTSFSAEIVSGSTPTAPKLLRLQNPSSWVGQKPYRLVRIKDKIFFTTHIVSGTTTDIALCPISSIYWDAPSNEDLGLGLQSFTLLPFLVVERNPGRLIGLPHAETTELLGYLSSSAGGSVAPPGLTLYIQVGDSSLFSVNQVINLTITDGESNFLYPRNHIVVEIFENNVLKLNSPILALDLTQSSVTASNVTRESWSVDGSTVDDFSLGEECLFEVKVYSGLTVQVPKTYLTNINSSLVLGYEDITFVGSPPLPPVPYAGKIIVDSLQGLTLNSTIYFLNNQEVIYDRTITAITGNVLTLSSAVFVLSDISDLRVVTQSVGFAPKNGVILANELEVGNQQTGPLPFYLYDGNVLPQTSEIMSKNLAASVEYRISFNSEP